MIELKEFYTMDEVVDYLSEHGVKQERHGVPFGQCTEASLATVLGVSLVNIPDMCLYGEHSWDPILDYLLQRGACLKSLRCNSGVSFALANEYIYDTRDCNTLHLIGGVTKNGVRHMEVGWRGIPVWNPGRSHCAVYDWIGFILPGEASYQLEVG